MKLITIIGARPQFVKAAAVSRAIERHNLTNASAQIGEIVVHTGQHYDFEMSEAFFQELGLAAPAHHLGVGSGTHGYQTGEMLKRIEQVLLSEDPTLALVYGDTNSTLAGAIAAAKLGIPVAHVEAGLRSYRRDMAEEINRVLTDRLSSLLFCPTKTALGNLQREGIRSGIHLVGDVMFDSLLANLPLAERSSNQLARLQLRSREYALATIHRAEHTDHPVVLRRLFHALKEIASEGLRVVVPLHPRTRERLPQTGNSCEGLDIISPVSYLEMLILEKHAKVILTDSGGVQKEAYWLRVPCVTLRDETEWVETVETGWNVLSGSEPDRIVSAAKKASPGRNIHDAYGDGRAADLIVQVIASWTDTAPPGGGAVASQ